MSSEDMYIPTGTYGGIYMQNTVPRLLDLETGEVVSLTKSWLRERMKDDLELLKEFEEESGKKSKLKDYLIRYLEGNPDAK
ncbi:MAG: hypothetical protein JW801_15980 [Bacteroidales bacterium]|nr:hypothetical protein [Bacteroidales bacterium]